MDFNKNYLDMSEISLLVLKIGSFAQEKANNLVRSLNQRYSRFTFSSADLREKTKTSFPQRNWTDQPWIRCKFIEAPYFTEWPEFHVCYKPLAAIGLYDRALSDFENFKEELSRFKKKVMDEKIAVSKIYLFNVGEAEVKNFEGEPNVLILPQVPEEVLMGVIEEDFQNFITSLVNYLTQEIQKLKNDSNNQILFNIKEEKLSDMNKLKKRKQGRSLKIMGDYSLLLCSFNEISLPLLNNDTFKDAMIYYNQAFEVLKSNGDFLWIGGTIEGFVAALVTKPSLLREGEKSSLEKNLEIEVVSKVKEASLNFKKTKFINFEVEGYFKLLNHLQEYGNSVSFNENVKYLIENLSGIPTDELCKVYCKLSSMYLKLKFFRKAGYYLRQLASLLAIEYPDLSKDFYLMAAPFYGFKGILSACTADGSKKRTGGEYNFGDENIKFWPKLQINFLTEFLYTCSQDPHKKSLITLELLQKFRTDLNQQQHSNCIKSLMNESLSSPFIIPGNLSFLPELIRIIPMASTSSFKQYNKDKKGDELFIYEPWKKNKLDLRYPLEDNINFKIIVTNSFPFDIFIDLITFVAEGLEVLHFPSSIYLSGNTKKIEIIQKIKPKTTGTLSIKGIITKCFNINYFHPVNEKGISHEQLRRNPEKWLTEDALNFDLNKIQVLERQPQFFCDFVRKDDLRFFDSEIVSIPLVLENRGSSPLLIKKLKCFLEFQVPPFQEYDIDIEKFKNLQENIKLTVLLLQPSPSNPASQYRDDELTDAPYIYFKPFPKGSCLKKITLIFYYLTSESCSFIHEYSLAREIEIVKLFDIHEFIVQDNYSDIRSAFITDDEKSQTYKVNSLDKDFYLSIGIRNLYENRHDFLITFFSPGTGHELNRENLHEGQGLRRNFRFSKFPKNEASALKDLIGIRWESKCSNARGILQLPDQETDDLKQKITLSEAVVVVTFPELKLTNGYLQIPRFDKFTFSVDLVFPRDVLIGDKIILSVNIRRLFKVKYDDYVEDNEEKEFFIGGKKTLTIQKGEFNEVEDNKIKYSHKLDLYLFEKGNKYEIVCFCLDPCMKSIFVYKHNTYLFIV